MGTLAVPTFQNKLHRSASQLRPQETQSYVCVRSRGVAGLLARSICTQCFAPRLAAKVKQDDNELRATCFAGLVEELGDRIAKAKKAEQTSTPKLYCCVCVRVCVNEYVCRVFCKVTHTHIRTGKLAPMHAHTLTQVRVHPRTHTHMHTLTCTGVRTHIRPYSTRNTHKNVDK